MAIVTIVTIVTTAVAQAQDTTRVTKPDSADAQKAAAASKVSAPPTYLVNPTTVLGMKFFPTSPSLSGYLSVRGTRLNDVTAFQINRGRLTVMEGPKSFLGIRIQGDFSTGQTGRLKSDSTVSAFTLTDAYVELVAPKAMLADHAIVGELRPSLIVGQFKTPFSLEYLTSFAALKTANRSQAVDRLSQKRDIGAQAQIGWESYVTLTAAVVNGAGPNVTTNANGTEMFLSRLTVTPLPWLEVSGKIQREQTDKAWGFDARALWRGLTVEGEGIYRKRPTSATVYTDAGAGYALISYKLLPWLEPVYKYDRYYDTRFTTRSSTSGGTTAHTGSTWNVLGANILTTPEWLRVQLDYVHHNERPTPGNFNEYIAQVVAVF
ncbi:MAG: OprO/OprP family phosphate-selective porin [Gemmatimonadota bacterium]|nr:OprO/OprP family phosphate-selective porin [Gemmatimonadota bacterium]